MTRWKSGGLILAAVASFCAGAETPDDYGRAVFVDRREPPAMRDLDGATRERYELGQLVVNSSWVAAGTPRAERRDGVGPLFNASSCDGCHNNGARGRAAGRDGLAPGSFVLQLGGPTGAYGHVFNTSALDGVPREGLVEIRSRVVNGVYADGTPWTLRAPDYRLVEPAYGAPDARLLLKPRVGPALFGVALLEAVPEDAIEAVRRSQPRAQRGDRAAGRFGWQAESPTVKDQTERALAREMGLTTGARPQDDCTALQLACRQALQGGTPEVSAEFLEAMLIFQREVAVPKLATSADPAGAALFETAGCAVCHRPDLPSIDATGKTVTIRAFTDLLVHDLGEGLADRRVDGRAVKTRFRTAPLWGVGYELTRGPPALLHDGRAGSIEEAILWHGGQAGEARRRFESLPAERRATLVRWISTQ